MESKPRPLQLAGGYEPAATGWRTPGIKCFAPPVPSWYVRRPELERKLDRAGDFRLTAVVAGAGFGKTTQLAARAHARRWAWYTVDRSDASPVILSRGLTAALRERLPALVDAVVPAGADERSLADSLAAALAEALELLLEDDLVLVVDDVHELDGGSAVRLLEGLTRYAPAELHLVLSSRAELAFPISRLRGRGQVLDIDAAALTFTRQEVATLLAGIVGEGAEDLAGPVYEATGGWPAAVQLAAATLATVDPAQRPGAAETLVRRRGPLFSYLAEEVFGRESSEVRRVVRAAAELDRVTPDLCEALGLPSADEVLRSLARRGLVLEPSVGSGDWYSLHALVRQFAREYWSLDAGEAQELQRRAAGWFEERGMLAEALDSFAAARDANAIARLISDRGQELNSSGAMDSVVRAAQVLPPASQSQRAALAVAYAHILLGDYEQAREWLSAVDAPPDDPSVSFNLAVMHMNRTEFREALAVLQAAEAAGCDEPMHNCLIAYQLLWLGRLAEARTYGERALAGAGFEPPTPLSDAHGVLGELALVEGDLAEAEAHFDAALDIAERAGNAISTIWSRTRLGGLRLEQGRYAEALEEATRAQELADRVGFSAFQAMAPTLRGLALVGLGRLDEATADFSAAIAVHERTAGAAAAGPLVGMGTVQAERGELSQARSSFERAAAAAERSGIVYPEALAGLARVLIDEDPNEAERLVQAAIAGAGEVAPVGVTLSGGWIALRRGDHSRARSAAESALAEATRRGTPALLAEALELKALSAAGPEAEPASLEEAVAIWSELGNPIEEAKAELALARIRGSVEDAVRAEGVLRDLGVRPTGGAAGILLPADAGRREPLAIRTLGRFAVLRDGEAVQVREWRSKKARDLLRLLVTRRGSSTPRDFLMEALWPDEDPALTSNRLSVALNAVRTALDPEHHFEPDRYVASTSDGIRLEHVSVDVEEFLEKADRALRLSEAEGPSQAVMLLEEAEAAYGGDFLEEDRYEDWAASLREEARTAYLDVLRALATASASESASRSSARYYLRILALDPFDEEIHLGLVSSLSAAGRHGEARRAYRRYVDRMNEIGVEPAPRPGR